MSVDNTKESNPSVWGEIFRSHKALFSSFFLGSFADWFDFIMISTLITYGWGLGASELAAAFISMAIPRIAFGSFSGSLVDKYPLVKIMSISLLVRAVILVLVAMFADGMEALCVLLFVKSFFSTLYLPTEQLSIKHISSSENVEKYTGILQIIHQGSKIFAPIIGGVLASALGATTGFLVCSGLYVLSFVFILFSKSNLDTKIESEASVEKVKVLEQMKLGFKHVVYKYPINITVLLMALTFFVIFLYDSFLAILNKNIGFSEDTLGLSLSFAGAGGILGSIMAIKLVKLVKSINLMIVSLLLCGPVIAYLGFLEMGYLEANRYLFLLAWIIIGFTTSTIIVPFNMFLIKETPKNSIGAVTGLNESIQTIGPLIGPVCGAVLAEYYGVGYVFFIGGMLLMACGIFGLISISFKKPQIS